MRPRESPSRDDRSRAGAGGVFHRERAIEEHRLGRPDRSGWLAGRKEGGSAPPPCQGISGGVEENQGVSRPAAGERLLRGLEEGGAIDRGSPAAERRDHGGHLEEGSGTSIEVAPAMPQLRRSRGDGGVRDDFRGGGRWEGGGEGKDEGRGADHRVFIGRSRPRSRAVSTAFSYPASACRITPAPGSLVSTRRSRASASGVPSATTTIPAWIEYPIPTPPP